MGAEPWRLCVALRLGAHTAESRYSWQKLGFESCKALHWAFGITPPFLSTALSKPVSFGHLWITGFPGHSAWPMNEKSCWSLYVQKSMWSSFSLRTPLVCNWLFLWDLLQRSWVWVLVIDRDCCVDRGGFSQWGECYHRRNQSKHSEISGKLKAKLKSIKLTKLCKRCQEDEDMKGTGKIMNDPAEKWELQCEDFKNSKNEQGSLISNRMGK